MTGFLRSGGASDTVHRLLRWTFLLCVQRRAPTVQTVQKTSEIPQVLFLDTVDARCCITPGAWVMTVQKTVEIPQLQLVDHSDQVVDISVVVQRQIPMVLF